MTDIDPRLKQLIMDKTAQVLKNTGLDKVPFKVLEINGGLSKKGHGQCHNHLTILVG